MIGSRRTVRASVLCHPRIAADSLQTRLSCRRRTCSDVNNQQILFRIGRGRNYCKARILVLDICSVIFLAKDWKRKRFPWLVHRPTAQLVCLVWRIFSTTCCILQSVLSFDNLRAVTYLRKFFFFLVLEQGYLHFWRTITLFLPGEWHTRMSIVWFAASENNHIIMTRKDLTLCFFLPVSGSGRGRNNLILALRAAGRCCIVDLLFPGERRSVSC